MKLQNRVLVIVTMLAAGFALQGCAAPGGVAKVPSGSNFSCDTDSLDLGKRLNIRSRVGRDDRVLNLLLLSGGGSHGAWGAGYLKGWKEAKSGKDGPPMPKKFDVVTGVSTGALQATYAFVGDFDAIYDIYTKTKSKDVYMKRSAITVPFANSLLKSAPLANLIRSRVRHDLLEEVNKQSEDRLLCVGAVNLETGRFREWDMTAIAAAYMQHDENSPAARELLNLYQTILLASSAIPVAFPPVEITDSRGPSLYVDGATRENLFIAFGKLLDFAMTTNLQLLGINVADDRRMADLIRFKAYVIVNGQLGTAPASVGNHFIPLALRSLDALMAEAMNGAIYHIEYELKKQSLGKMFETDFTYIPANECPLYSSLDFNPPAMTRLAEKAADYGREGRWFEFQPDSGLSNCEPVKYAR